MSKPNLTRYRIDAEPDIADWLIETQVLAKDDTLQQIATFVERWRKDHCYADDDCVLNTNGVGESVDMSDFWKEWDRLVNDE